MSDLNENLIKNLNDNVVVRQNHLESEKSTALGTLLILISAAGFGLMAIFIKYAYMAKLNELTILSIRFFLTAIIMWGIVFLKGLDPRLDKKQLFALLGLGAMGYGLMSSFFFSTVKLIPASIASILLYTYPVMVTVLSSIFYKEKITRNKLLALVISSIGLIMTVGLVFKGLNALGLFCGIMSAVTYAIYIVASNKYVKKVDPIICTTYITTAAAIVFNITGWVTGAVDLKINSMGWLALGGITIFSSVIAILTFFQGMRVVGPSRASIISTMEPVVTIFSAFLLFGEKLSPLQLIGTILVISAVILTQKETA